MSLNLIFMLVRCPESKLQTATLDLLNVLEFKGGLPSVEALSL